MTCLQDNNQGAELLIGYLEDTLSAAERRELENHAAECAECRGLLAVQATLDIPVPAVSADFDAKLYARIAADEARQPWWKSAWWKQSWKVYAPVVGVAAMLAVAVFVPREPEPQAPVISQDVQQLEQALEDLELLMPATEAL